MTPYEQQAFLKTHKGAGLSILFALALCGGALTASQLANRTGYSDKPITAALDSLQLGDMVVNHGRRVGWTLTAGIARQLQLGFAELADGADLSTELLTGVSGPIDRNNSELTGDIDRNNSDLANDEDRRNSDLTPQTDPIDRRNSDLSPIDRKNSEQNPLLSSSKEKEEEKTGAHIYTREEIHKRSHILAAAGVGRQSSKFEEILRAAHPTATLKAWQTYGEAAKRGHIKHGRGAWTPGHFIRKVTDGDPLPDVDICATCYRPKDAAGRCVHCELVTR